VNLLTLTHYQGSDLGYSFINDFCHWLIRDSLIFARLLAVGMGIGLYVGQLIVIGSMYSSHPRALIKEMQFDLIML